MLFRSVFAWTAEGSTLAFNPAGFTISDIFGNSRSTSTLTDYPIIFTSPTLSPATLMSNIMTSLSSQPNLNPLIQPLNNQSVVNGQLLQFTVSATDPDNDPITYSVNSLPAGASLNAQTGLFSWTPSSAAGKIGRAHV